ncbi:MAG: energy-coupled thiamine transporter ThiT [Acholeplasmatales bacterium]|nr:energy-coupled thiamine transporter ThiT [Acholeplasmatales bacterium]
MQTKNKNLQALIEVAIFSAIAIALDMIQGSLFKGLFPSGGSIGVAMVPILVVSFRRGFGWGVMCGFVVSILQMLSGVYSINAASFDNKFLQVMGPFLQIMLDYVFAYTLVGFAGLFSNLYQKSKSKGGKVLFVSLGSVLGGTLKYLTHVIAGAVFWLNQGSSFGGLDDTTVLYSWLYNGAYSIPNIIICTIIMIIFALYYDVILKPSAKESIEEAVEEE